MKQLYLLRHAHAEPHSFVVPDFERPLDKRGQKEAKALATYVHKNNFIFDLVMCSAARRARETFEPLRSVVGTDAIEISENFYNLPEDEILYNLRQVDEDIKKVLYIGHNPGIAFSILKFAKVLPRFLMEGVSPATLTGLQFTCNKWIDLEWGTGEIIDVFQPGLVV